MGCVFEVAVLEGSEVHEQFFNNSFMTDHIPKCGKVNHCFSYGWKKGSSSNEPHYQLCSTSFMPEKFQ